MSVDAATKTLLQRWLELTKPGALERVKTLSLVFWILGLIVFLAVGLAISQGYSPVIVAGGGMVAGWLIAETNALRARITQWSTFQRYLDWNRIEQDLKDIT